MPEIKGKFFALLAIPFLLGAVPLFVGDVNYSGTSIDKTAMNISNQLSTNIVDDFEDQDISKYTVEDGSASDVSFDTDSKNGNQSIAFSNSTNSIVNIYSTSGLVNYLDQGDTVKFWFKPKVGQDFRNVRFFFGVNGSLNDRYAVLFDGEDNDLFINKKVGDVFTQLTSVNMNIDEGQWNEASVKWTTGDTITVTVFEENGSKVGSTSVNDSAFSDGGIGFGSKNQGDTTLFDYARIVN